MQNKSTMTAEGEFVGLNAGTDVTESQWYNEDIAPTQITQRTWGKWNIAALWVGMSICVPTYALGGVLTAYFGLSVSEALWTILLANVVVLIPLILNAFVGTKYGIPFPVVLRSSFGIVGSNIPCLIRAIVACGWFGIQTLFGGLAIHKLLSVLIPAWANLGGTGEVLGFFIFWAMNLFVVIRGSESIKWLETLSAPLLLAVSLGLIIWAYPKASFTEVLATPANRPADAPFIGYFLSGLTAMVGFWATLSLNIPDFSRYANSQKSQIWGQILGLPLTMFMFASLGVILTAASQQLVGKTISEPVSLIGAIGDPFWGSIAMVFIIIATLSTNTAANIVSPTNDFQNIAPRKITHTKAVLLTGIVGILLMGWELLRKLGLIISDVSVESLYKDWLIGYSSLLGPIAGIMIVDYFVIRKQRLDIPALYHGNGEYKLWNWAGFVAFLVPVALTLFAQLTGQLSWFASYGWFTGSILGAIIYLLLGKVAK